MRTPALLVLALALAACGPKAPPAPAVEAAVEAPAQAEPSSVKPGINDNFLDPELDVDKWVERFGAESREVVAQQAAIVEAMALQPGENVADIGAGTGLYMKPFAEGVGPDGVVFAVDISPKFLEHLMGMAADNGWSNVKTVQAADTSSNLPKASVDAVFICDTYHHFEYPEETLASLFTAIKPGGRLFVLDFKRVEGESTDWILDHVRAGQDVFTDEITAAGFAQPTVLDVGLEENYLLRFERP